MLLKSKPQLTLLPMASSKRSKALTAADTFCKDYLDGEIPDKKNNKTYVIGGLKFYVKSSSAGNIIVEYIGGEESE